MKLSVGEDLIKETREMRRRLFSQIKEIGKRRMRRNKLLINEKE